MAIFLIIFGSIGVLMIAMGVLIAIRTAALGAAPADRAKPGTLIVRTYRSDVEFERDANRLAAKGWTIQTQSSRTKKFSAATGVLTNKGVTTVTYVRG
jgi:hypothetical protein